MGTAIAILATDETTSRAESDLRNSRDMTTGATDSDTRALELCYWFVGWVLPISTLSFPLVAWVRELAFIYVSRLGKGIRSPASTSVHPANLSTLVRPCRLHLLSALQQLSTLVRSCAYQLSIQQDSTTGKTSNVELTTSIRRLKLSPLLPKIRISPTEKVDTIRP